MTTETTSPLTSPVACRFCGGPTIGWGKDREGNPRRFCKACRKSFGLIPERPLGRMRISLEKATLCATLLTEGSSIRSTERITGVHRDTVCRLLRVVGEKCERLLSGLVRATEVDDVQCDELWAYIAKKEKTKVQKKETSPKIGDSYTWLGMERNSKLILAHHVGRRTSKDANLFMAKLSAATSGSFQLSTDAFGAYPEAVEKHLGGRVDYATVKKIFAAGADGEHRYSPPSIIAVEKEVISGDPDEARACTSHVERQNLDVRMKCRRFTRLSNGFSKKWENHKAAVSLFVAAQNLCWINRTIRCTPAMAAGLVRKPWTVGMLLAG
jgi:IS1 family transposase/transposase-like protein